MNQNIDKKWTFLTITKYSSLLFLIISVVAFVCAAGFTFLGWDLVITAANETASGPEDETGLTGLTGLIFTWVGLIAIAVTLLSIAICTMVFVISSMKLKKHNQSVANSTAAVVQPNPYDLGATTENNEAHISQ